MSDAADLPSQRTVFSVSQLNRAARELLEAGFGRLWVEGEVSNLSCPQSGHLYFTLKDAQAQVSCALFRTQALRLGFRPANGLQVLVQGRVSLYEPRGNYQLIVTSMEESGDGALRRAFEALKQRLFAEGLFEDAHKQPLPEFTRRIGVITSPSGAAIRDVLSVLRKRFPGIEVIIYPVQVQGPDAARQIVAALSRAQQRNECDVLLLTRGGGSLEDLWPFNEEAVARAVHACPIPIVSAVGHEIDFVITDFVADRRAPTPSAAAELLSPDQQHLVRRIVQIRQRLAALVRQRLGQVRQQLAWSARRIQQLHPQRRLQQQAQRLDELEQRLRRTTLQRLAQLHARCQTTHAGLLRHSPAVALQGSRARLGQVAQRLVYCETAAQARRQERLAVVSRALQTVSPLATLRRGYSITMRAPAGTLLMDSLQVSVGDRLETRLAQGTIYSQVTEIDS
jgi:exodeoxyribonuclease VII large subunit